MEYTVRERERERDRGRNERGRADKQPDEKEANNYDREQLWALVIK